VRRHHLTATEAAQVVSAVKAGGELEDARMRAAAVELAELTLEQVLPSWHEASVARRVVIAVTAVWVALVLVGAVFVAAFQGPGEVPWLNGVLVLVIVGATFVQSRKLRRTIELNSSPARGASSA
jgi:hypothetical protein